MGDEFQAEVCGGSWWNPSRSMFGSSPCASGISDLGGFGWPNDLLDMKARSSDESGSASDGSIVIQDMQKQPNQPESASGSSSLPMDSSLQIMGIGLSSSTTDWNRALLQGNGRPETNYPPILLQLEDPNSSMNYEQETGMDCPDEQIQKDWTFKNFSNLVEDDSSSNISSFKSTNIQDFSLDHQKPLNSISTSTQCTTTTTAAAATACQGLSTGFPIGSLSYGYSSSLLQTLFDPDPQPSQQTSLYGNRPMNVYPASTNNYQSNLNEFLPKFSPLANSSLPKFLNNTNPCNASSAPAPLNNFSPNQYPFASQSQLLSSTFSDKPSLLNLTGKTSNEDVQGMGSMAKKSTNEPAFKRPRIETPSPLPTFKVRKEKLGDRITAIQQLVSPFGKTDTASVLHEAIEYIKFLHDQVGVLSTPYLRNGSPVQRQQQTCDINITKDQEGAKQDLKSRGLCLVPISSTFPVAAESTADFWTPTFGGTFR